MPEHNREYPDRAFEPSRLSSADRYWMEMLEADFANRRVDEVTPSYDDEYDRRDYHEDR